MFADAGGEGEQIKAAGKGEPAMTMRAPLADHPPMPKSHRSVASVIVRIAAISTSVENPSCAVSLGI